MEEWKTTNLDQDIHGEIPVIEFNSADPVERMDLTLPVPLEWDGYSNMTLRMGSIIDLPVSTGDQVIFKLSYKGFLKTDNVTSFAPLYTDTQTVTLSSPSQYDFHEFTFTINGADIRGYDYMLLRIDKITGSPNLTNVGICSTQLEHGVSVGAGPTGYQGVTGLIGFTGSQGFTGAYGGPPGETGIQGVTGIIGDTGIRGYTGAQGETGAQGYTGVQGYTGDEGYTGAQGETGAQAITGLQGITGIDGVQGNTGYEGITGLQGVLGDTGYKGITGPGGVEGQTGLQGVTGISFTGLVGETGAQGYTGSQGDTGLSGITGLIGFTGVGPVGETGIQGATGSQGNTGIQGQVGATGVLTVVVDGGGATITTGVKADLCLPYSLKISDWTLIAEPTGSILIGVWDTPYASAPPTVANAMHTGETGPYIIAGIKNQATTAAWGAPTGTTGDILRVYVDSVSSVQVASLSLGYFRI
jgi:hypothetical protein